MNYALLFLVLGLLMLGLGIRSRLVDIRAMALAQGNDALSSLQTDRCLKYTKGLATAIVLFAIVQLVILISLPLIFKLKGFLALMPLSALLTVLVVICMGDVTYGSKYLGARRASFANCARILNNINMMIIASFIVTDLIQ